MCFSKGIKPQAIRSVDVFVFPPPSPGFTVGSVLKNQSEFRQFLVRNLSLPSDTAGLLLSTPVNLSEVWPPIASHRTPHLSPQHPECQTLYRQPEPWISKCPS